MPPHRSGHSNLPEFWKEAPDPVQYKEQKRSLRKFNQRTLGLCQCPTCCHENAGLPGVVRFEVYSDHYRVQSRWKEDRYVCVNKRPEFRPRVSAESDGTPRNRGASPLSEERNRPANIRSTSRSTSPHPSHTPNPSSVTFNQSCVSQPDSFDMQESDSEDPPVSSPSSLPASACRSDNSILRTMVSSVWVDFVAEIEACTQPIVETLTIQQSFKPPPKEPLSTFEKVMYGTNMALVGQWNVSHAAIQFNMAQAWNLFEYGLLLGRQISTPSPTADLGLTNQQQLNRLIAQNTFPRPVQTLRSAERHLSPNQRDILIIHAACTNVDCQHVFHSIRNVSEFQVGATCSECKQPPDGKNVGLVPYPRMPLPHAIWRFLQIPGMENLCDEKESRRQKDEKFDKQHYSGTKIYRDAYSGSGWALRPLTGHSVSDSAILMLRLNIGIDWYQPSRTSTAQKQSVGPIIAHVANLPLQLRADLSLALLLGITPGPCEIRGNHLYQYLLPLCIELRQARLFGITVTTPKHPDGRLIYIDVGSLCCDAPARVSVTGGPNFNRMEEFCIRCDLVKKQLLLPEKAVWRGRQPFRRTGKVYAQRKKCLDQLNAALEEQDPDDVVLDTWTNRHTLAVGIEKKTMKTPGHPSAFDLVPLFDKELAATHDPMHMLCIGLMKVFFKNIMYVGDKYRHEVAKPPKKKSYAKSKKLPVVSPVAALINAEEDEEVNSESSADEGASPVDDEAEEPTRPSLPPTFVQESNTCAPSGTQKTTNAAQQQGAQEKDRQGEDAQEETPPMKLAPKVKKSVPLLTPWQKNFLHELMLQVMLPPEVDGIAAGTFFKGVSGGASAAQWKTFNRHYAAFVLIELWTHNEAIRTATPGQYNPALTENELRMLLKVVQIGKTALRPVISTEQIKLLRFYIGSLQDAAYRERATIVRCSNLHWLSHLPDDIERYGPVYSWWLFGFERTNKILKGANSNGHPQDTPLIAYNKYLRLGFLGEWATSSSSDDNLPEQHLARQSQIAFNHAIASANSTEEQKDARSWRAERDDDPISAERPGATIVFVQQKQVAPIYKTDLEALTQAWNSDALITVRVRVKGSRQPNNVYVVNEHATFLIRLRLGRHHFRTLRPGDHILPLDDDAHTRLRGTFFEWRTDGEIFQCRKRRAPVGILESVLEVEAVRPDKKKVSKLFMKVHMLKPFESRDPYRFGDRLPYANIWLWHPMISKCQILPFSNERIDCMRPVAMKPMLVEPGNAASPKIWAIQALTH